MYIVSEARRRFFETKNVNLQRMSTFSIFSSLIEAQSKKGTSNFKFRAYNSLPVWLIHQERAWQQYVTFS